MKRLYLTKKERAAMLASQGGICAHPGCKSAGPFIAEHTLPVELGNEKKPDCLLCRAHAYLKTVNVDMPAIRKADRQSGRTGQQARRAAGKTQKIPARPFPAAQRPMQSRPFSKWKPEAAK